MIIEEDDYLEHFGTPRHSGRYPWGSGGDKTQTRNMQLIDYIDEQKRAGLSEVQIAKGMGISTTQLRAKKTIANQGIRNSQILRAQALKAKGMSDTEAAKQMGLPGSTYRSLLEPGARDRNQVLTQTVNMLKEHVDREKYIDVGSGVESYVQVGNGVENTLGISKQKLHAATEVLKEQGYNVHRVDTKQPGTGLETHRLVLTQPGVTQKEVWENRDNIKQITSFSSDGGRSYGKIHDPISLDPNRIQVKYKDDGGSEADGVLFVRPGIPELSIGNSNYAQVRVLVGNSHYLKGMAMYKDDLPPGVDVVFNTNKNRTGNKLDAMKSVTGDKDFPFGTVVRQIVDNPGTPHERVTSAMNIVNEEGDWSKWSRSMSSQMLSKQSPSLAKRQLDITFERRRKELDEINALTNPTVKKKLLGDFAANTDKAAANQKAAALPRSVWHVILPVKSLKPGEVYAPNYNDGEVVALIRHPHGGTFEIPQLVVNNRHRESRSIIGNARDAIGIHPSVAHQLSGADFDGDTVLVIPNTTRKIKSSPALEGLKNFDPQHDFAVHVGEPPRIDTQLQMGRISNLITDMTLKGAPHEHMVRAIKHSMVVIDAEKHGLDWKESERKHGITALKAEYQGKGNAGAATLISRRGSTIPVPDRRLRRASKGGPIDPTTGRKVFEPTGKTRIDQHGNRVPVMQRVKKIDEALDVHTLSSGTPMEHVYADHANKLKNLANEARLSEINTPRLKRSASAKKVYATEVHSLDSKLALVIRNRPREREAQTISNAAIKAKFAANPNLDEKSKKRIRFAELNKARDRVGAKQEKIKITDREWEAIQAGAISENKLVQILQKADMSIVRKHATPKREILMTPTQTSRAKAMLRSGATRAEVAKALGVSLTTLDNATHSAMALEG